MGDLVQSSAKKSSLERPNDHLDTKNTPDRFRVALEYEGATRTKNGNGAPLQRCFGCRSVVDHCRFDHPNPLGQVTSGSPWLT